MRVYVTEHRLSFIYQQQERGSTAQYNTHPFLRILAIYLQQLQGRSISARQLNTQLQKGPEMLRSEHVERQGCSERAHSGEPGVAQAGLALFGAM